MLLQNRRDDKYKDTSWALPSLYSHPQPSDHHRGPTHPIERPRLNCQIQQTLINAPSRSTLLQAFLLARMQAQGSLALTLAIFDPQFLSAQHTMRPGFFLLISVALACSASLTLGVAPGAQHCLGDFDKVTSCLDFVQGKGAAPPKQCCVSVGEIRESDPACLCFFIEQIHNGSSPMIKSMNIQESRLLQLPSACNLKNSSVSDCPKLLGIPPSSPDYAIFANASSSTATPATAGTGTQSSPVTAGNSSSGIVHGCMSAPAILLVTTLFASFPRWFEL